MDSDNEVVRNNYEEQLIKWIVAMTNADEMQREIEAIIDKENNGNILQMVLGALIEEKIMIDELIELTDLEKEKIEFQKDKNSILTRLEIVRKCLNDYNNKMKLEQQLELIGGAKVLFSTNQYGNIMIDRDLKKIRKNCSEEVYESFLKLIEDLVSGVSYFNPIKQKPIQSDSHLIKGLYEKKDFQARIVYRYVQDYIVIVGATLKKADLDRVYREFCINCKSHSEDFLKKIQQGKVNIDELVAQSSQYIERVLLKNRRLQKLWMRK